MSYPDQAPARRPTVVTLAVTLLVVMALTALAYAAAGLSTLPGTVDDLRSAAGDTSARGEDVDSVAALVWISGVLSAVASVLAALVLAGLAVGLSAGRPAVRVATWVVSGLGLLLGCCGLLTLAGQRSVPLRLNADERGIAEVLPLVADAYPGWWLPLGAGLSVGQVFGYLVVAVLLALPAASSWFGRHRADPPGPHRPDSVVPPGPGQPHGPTPYPYPPHGPAPYQYPPHGPAPYPDQPAGTLPASPEPPR